MIQKPSSHSSVGGRIAVYVPGSCSLFSMGAIQAPFFVANQLLEDEKYHFTWYASPGEALSEALQNVGAVGCILDDVVCDLLIILSHSIPRQPLTVAEKHKLRQLSEQKNIQIIACHAAPFWLAESGLLTHQPVALHWSCIDDFSERFPALMVSDRLYTTKAKITTCVGQVAILDCLISFLEIQEGHDLAYAISDQLGMERIRASDERQRFPEKRLDVLQPRLTMAIELMENNIEEPLSTGDIAGLMNISSRQLERLFKRYLDTMPARYYLQLRLKKARQLLLSTNSSIVQIGLRCGFSSGAHFSSAYKSFYHTTPREERSKKFHDGQV